MHMFVLIWYCGHFLKEKESMCCGANKRVGPANNFKYFMRVSVLCQPETMKGDRRRDNRYNKVTFLLPELQTCM